MGKVLGFPFGCLTRGRVGTKFCTAVSGGAQLLDTGMEGSSLLGMKRRTISLLFGLSLYSLQFVSLR